MNEANIKQLVENADFGLTLNEIADEMGMSRPTAVNYLNGLVERGDIHVRKVGNYKLYYVKKEGEKESFTRGLYLGLLSLVRKTFLGNVDKLSFKRKFARAGKKMSKSFPLPGEPVVAQFKAKAKRFEDLQGLARVVSNFLVPFKLSRGRGSVSVVPPVGETTPQSLLIRLEDPSFPSKEGAHVHYYLVASIVEAKLREKGLKVNFRVYSVQGDEVFFELGFIQNYYLDFSIVRNSSESRDDRNLLEAIKMWISANLRHSGEFYFDPVEKKLHYKATFPNNRDVEAFLELLAKILLDNMEVAKELGLKPTRKWVPFEEWPEDIFATVDVKTNIDFLFSHFQQSALKVYPYASYCTHYERTDAGFRIHHLEEVDFDFNYSNPHDSKRMQELYRKIGVNSEDYFRLRAANYEKVRKGVEQARRMKKTSRKKKKSAGKKGKKSAGKKGKKSAEKKA
ncbi:MAG: helix-turn-helix domain-containing protein [Promethearchaeota archaeon]